MVHKPLSTGWGVVSRLGEQKGRLFTSASREGRACGHPGAGPGGGGSRAGKSVSPRGRAGKLGSSSRLEDSLGFR